jgi:glycine/D-amino acid oxidase-like deaminating enzyme
MREWLREQAGRLETYGAGPVREHPGAQPYQPVVGEAWDGIPDGSDLLLDRALIGEHFAFVRDDAIAVSRVRRAGWFDAVRLGAWLLERAHAHGARIVRDSVVGISTAGGALTGVRLASGSEISTRRMAIAAGPRLPAMLAALGIDLPVFLELHSKMQFTDRLGVVPRLAPFTIWNDPVGMIDWSAADRARFGSGANAQWLYEPFSGGLHIRPIGNERELLLIWTFETSPHEFVWPPVFDPHLGDVLLHGFAHVVPRASAYIGEASRGYVDGGYYTKTPENRPMVGPLPISGVFISGAVSGYGIMASHAAGELLATHMTGGTLPSYAAALSPERYADPEYRRRLEGWDAKAGQL